MVEAYLRRIGCGRSAAPGPEQLRELQLAHLRAVPFENLSIHLGEPIVLDAEVLVDKIVTRGRGGFCYELNGAFAALLTALGYRVQMRSARVHGPEGLGPPYDHMALEVGVEAASESWLVDVGFGSFTHYPVPMRTGVDHQDPAGVVRISSGLDGDLDVYLDGRPQYRMDARPAQLADFVPTCWWQATSPDSPFTRSVTCSRLTETGRVTLSGHRLIFTEGGQRREEDLAGEGPILAAYRAHFGIVLDRLPGNRQGR